MDTRLLALCILAASFALALPGCQTRAEPVVARGGDDLDQLLRAAGEGESPPERETLRVHVVGAVAEPGVYSLPRGARVEAAIEAAGGAAAEADLEAINLADFLKDGEQVRLPSRPPPGEQATPATPPAGGATGRYPGGEPSPSGGPAPAASGGPVNINSAAAADLQRLPGIGPVLAERIIEYRARNGPFQRPEDLIFVSGIGERTFEQLRDRVTVR